MGGRVGGWAGGWEGGWVGGSCGAPAAATCCDRRVPLRACCGRFRRSGLRNGMPSPLAVPCRLFPLELAGSP
eukprot:9815183-Lingulodinium_polyedra.AAC.1